MRPGCGAVFISTLLLLALIWTTLLSWRYVGPERTLAIVIAIDVIVFGTLFIVHWRRN